MKRNKHTKVCTPFVGQPITFHLEICPFLNLPEPGASVPCLYSSSAFKLSGSQLVTFFFRSLRILAVVTGADKVVLELMVGPCLHDLAFEASADTFAPGALWRLLNSPSQRVISSVRKTIFSVPTPAVFTFCVCSSALWVLLALLSKSGEMRYCKQGALFGQSSVACSPSSA